MPNPHLNLDHLKRLSQDWRHLNNKSHPSIEDLILLYECYQELKAHGRKSEAELARKFGYKNRSQLNRDLKALQRKLGKQLITSSRRDGTGANPACAETVELLEHLLLAYQKLMCRPEQPLVVHMATPEFLCLRLLPELQQQLQEAFPEVQIKVTPRECRDILAEDVDAGYFDLVLTFCPPDHEFGPELEVRETRLRRCFLLPNNDLLVEELLRRLEAKELALEDLDAQKMIVSGRLEPGFGVMVLHRDKVTRVGQLNDYVRSHLPHLAGWAPPQHFVPRATS
jgi:DNA-binding transcriptional LysR family regulator